MAFKIIHNQTQIVRLGGKKQKKCAQRNLWNTPAIMCTIPTSMPEFSQTCNKCNVFVPLIFVSPPPSLVCVCVRGGCHPKESRVVISVLEKVTTRSQEHATMLFWREFGLSS